MKFFKSSVFFMTVFVSFYGVFRSTQKNFRNIRQKVLWMCWMFVQYKTICFSSTSVITYVSFLRCSKRQKENENSVEIIQLCWFIFCTNCFGGSEKLWRFPRLEMFNFNWSECVRLGPFIPQFKAIINDEYKDFELYFLNSIKLIDLIFGLECDGSIII